jgi:5-aminovalerate/4-aminobutyrate aminotransferase
MRVAREETFGPVAPLFRFKTEAEAIAWPTTPSSAWPPTSTAATSAASSASAEALEYGMVGINTGLISTEVVPFGGVKNPASAAKARTTASRTTSRSSTSAWGAYHGRTMMTLGLTGKVVPYSAGMGLMPGGIFRALYPNELHGVSVDDSIASIERIFKNDAEPRDIAAIIIEPVQGEGGFYVAPKPFMKRLRELCDKHGILLIADEVQTGAGRTGTFFAMEQMGVTADLTTFAKSIAGGFPLAGVCGKAEYMDAIAPGGLGGTYAGSPIACAAALAVLEVFEEEHLLDRCKAVGERLVSGLKAIQAKYPVIGDVRALGAMIAIELFEGGDTHKPNAAAVAAVVAKAREKGLILLSCGPYGNVLRILVPLTAPDEQLDKGLAIIEECFSEL